MAEKSLEQINLTTGLDLMGKITLNVSEWTGKFAEKQM